VGKKNNILQIDDTMQLFAVLIHLTLAATGFQFFFARADDCDTVLSELPVSFRDENYQCSCDSLNNTTLHVTCHMICPQCWETLCAKRNSTFVYQELRRRSSSYCISYLTDRPETICIFTDGIICEASVDGTICNECTPFRCESEDTVLTLS
jgi:hypothetical protein